MRKKLRRKDLKGPDEFITTTQRIISQAREHSRELAWAAAGGVFLLGVALGVRAYRESRQEGAEDALGVAYEAFKQEDFTRAAGLFAGVSEDWAGTPQATLALAYAGNAHMEAGNVEGGRRSFEELLASAPNGSELRQLALYNLGVLDRLAGDSVKAEERLREAANAVGPFAGAAWAAAYGATGKFIAPDDSVPSGVGEGLQEYLEAQRPPAASS